ncbi:MAG: ABC transporter substrate-binding protein [Actinobacteria bacterium]|nr:ABC transporter substrate-binding protein [Actinomycetota bacterium]
MKTPRPRRTNPGSALARLGLAGLGLALALTGCSAPGSGASKPAESTAAADTVTAPITAEQVSSLGEVTLHVWADQGEESLMKLIVPKYEQEFTNVKVDIQYKSFNDLTATVVNALNSTDAPDVAQGNQGWATDGALVKAGLVRQLDDVADAYGYRAAAGSAISQLQWSPDGKTFGSGTVYGLSPDNQMVGIFYNKAKLTDLGLQAPATFDDLVAALAKAKSAGEVPLMLGNSDKATAMQAFSVVQGAMTPAADTVGWITGKTGSDFNNATNQKALDTWTSWVKDGYIADGYDARSPDDAAAAFAKGQGVFLIAGNWQAGTVSDGAKFGFIAAPKSSANQAASSGSFGLN